MYSKAKIPAPFLGKPASAIEASIESAGAGEKQAPPIQNSPAAESPRVSGLSPLALLLLLLLAEKEEGQPPSS